MVSVELNLKVFIQYNKRILYVNTQKYINTQEKEQYKNFHIKTCNCQACAGDCINTIYIPCINTVYMKHKNVQSKT